MAQAAAPKGQKSLPVKPLHSLVGHGAAIRCVKFSANGNYCVSGGYDKTVRLWNPYSNKLIRQYLGHGYQVIDVDVSQDSNFIASCGGDKQPFLWDVTSGQVIRKFQGHLQQINCISFAAEDSLLITGSYDQTTKIWDCKSRSYQAIQSLEDAKDSITDVVVTDHEILTTSVDGCIRTYDLRRGEVTSDQIGQSLTCLQLSHDGNVMLVGSLDNTVRLLDKDDGTMYKEYKGHKNKDFKLDSLFSNDDAYVLSGSEDGTIYIWGLEEGDLVQVLSGHSKTVAGLTFHPKLPFMISASADKTLKLWGTADANLDDLQQS